ncbi:MAG: AAA family ATPase [Pseudonocardiaceae bacterium]|nr:AAA family ATPase [Pseudonocardiaceae bacterium]
MLLTRPVRFFGGKGGVGKTTLAAAFGLAQAGRQLRTLVVSTDPAHSLGDVFGAELADEPREVAAHLWAAEISGEQQARNRVEEIIEDAHAALPREVMPAVRRHLELATDSPGTVESALLDRLTQLVAQVGDRWDRLVVDSAPTGHMLRLLSLPALLTPWIEGLARQRERVRGMDRMVAGMTGRAQERADPLLERLHARRERLENLGQRLRDEAAVHLVLVPELLPLAETLRTVESLTQAGMRLRPLIVNRVLPDDDAGLLGKRRGQQDEVLDRLAAEAGELGVLWVPMLAGSLTTGAELTELAEHLAAAR